MGQSLALNIVSKGYSVSVFNRHGGATRKFMENRVHGHEERMRL
ncbi:MAG: NAD(P)-binding domain-containing protein, partial [Coriobacteriaceae bacterium]|nr:NAD(P)-binding domain-containing protein [Coriobacteriaceae bacterium]